MGPGNGLGNEALHEQGGDDRTGHRRVRGVGKVAVIAPGFSADCLETLEELAIRGRHDFLVAGGSHFAYLPCLNDGAPGMAMLRALIGRQLEGWLAPQ